MLDAIEFTNHDFLLSLGLMLLIFVIAVVGTIFVGINKRKH